jgi:ubiquinol oxidase
VVLETVAAVPGMVGGVLQHLKALRRFRDDQGWIRELLDEAENERMHLMAFIEIAKPSLFERVLILIAQGVFLTSISRSTCSFRAQPTVLLAISRKRR